MPEGLKTDLPIKKQVEMLYQSVCIDANRKAWEVCGFKSKEEIVGKKYNELVQERTLDEAFKCFVKNNYQIKDFEAHQIFLDGKTYYHLHSWFGVVENGVLTHLWTGIKDITERKMAEEDLRERTAELTQAQEIAHLGSWTWDMVTNEIEWSDEEFRIFGLEKQPVNYDLVEKYMVPDDRARVREEISNSIAENRPFSMEFSLLRPNGQLRTVYAEGRVTARDDEGKPLQMVGMNLDITERKQTEEKLRKQEETIRSIVETSRDWIWAIDLEGNHTFSNPALKDILGYESEELIGISSLELMHEEDRKSIQELLPKWIAEKKGWQNLVIRWKHKDGSYRFLESNAVPIQDTEGELIGFRGVDRDITERKVAEETLRESEIRYRSLFDNASEGIFIAQDGVLKLLNPKTEKIAGYSREELENKPFVDIIYPDDRETVLSRHKRRQAGEEITATYPFRIVDKNGDIKWVQINAALIDWEKKPAVLVFLNDITEQKKAEEELKKLSLAVEQSPVSVVISDPEGNIEYVNSVFTKVTGYSPEEVLGQNPRFLKAGDLPSSFYKELWDTIKAGTTWQGDFINKKKNGEEFWESASISPILDDNGEITHFVAVKQDITDRKRADEELRESEERYRVLIENAPEAVVLIDMDEKRFVDANENAEALFKLSREVLLRKGPLELSPVEQPDGRPSAEAASGTLSRAFEGETPVFEWTHLTSTGEEIPCEIRLVRLPSKTKKLIRGSIIDITERKKMEEKRQQLDKIKSDFIMLVAHEIATPLTVVLGRIGILKVKMEALGVETSDSFERIEKSLERIARLKRDMDDLSLLEQTRFQVKREHFLINYIVKNAVKDFQPQASDKSIEIHSKLPSLGTLIGDEDRIYHVLSVLLSNAIQYTPKGGEVEVTGNETEEMVEIVVKDNGIGISKENQAKVFDRFYRVQDIMGHKEGFGLGLSIAKGIIEEHGGRIWVESAIGKGSAFHFTLPRKQ